LEDLSKRGFNDVQTVTTAEEDIQFSLPKELRKDLKASIEKKAAEQKAN